MTLSDILSFVALALVSGLGIYFHHYLKEKAKNLATHEDIAKITGTVESIKASHERDLAAIRSDLEKDNRRMQAELDRTVLVHRVQFETEFRALSNVWEALSLLRSAMSSLRPTMTIVDSREDPIKALQERFNLFEEMRRKFGRAVDDQSPFYSREIFELLAKIIMVASRESVDVMLYGANQTHDWYEKGAANFGELCGGAEKVSDLIRDRISHLTVVQE